MFNIHRMNNKSVYLFWQNSMTDLIHWKKKQHISKTTPLVLDMDTEVDTKVDTEVDTEVDTKVDKCISTEYAVPDKPFTYGGSRMGLPNTWVLPFIETSVHHCDSWENIGMLLLTFTFGCGFYLYNKYIL